MDNEFYFFDYLFSVVESYAAASGINSKINLGVVNLVSELANSILLVFMIEVLEFTYCQG